METSEPEDKPRNADAVIRVRGSPLGAEFEPRTTEEPEVDVAHTLRWWKRITQEKSECVDT